MNALIELRNVNKQLEVIVNDEYSSNVNDERNLSNISDKNNQDDNSNKNEKVTAKNQKGVEGLTLAKFFSLAKLSLYPTGLFFNSLTSTAPVSSDLAKKKLCILDELDGSFVPRHHQQK